MNRVYRKITAAQTPPPTTAPRCTHRFSSQTPPRWNHLTHLNPPPPTPLRIIISSLTPIHHHHVPTWWTSKHITVIVISLNPIHHIYYNRFKQPLTLQLHSNQFTTNSPQNTSLPLTLSLQIYQLRNHQHTPHHLTTTTRPSNRFPPPQKQPQYHSSRLTIRHFIPQFTRATHQVY